MQNVKHVSLYTDICSKDKKNTKNFNSFRNIQQNKDIYKWLLPRTVCFYTHNTAITHTQIIVDFS